MLCGIVDFYSDKSSADRLFSMGACLKNSLPYAAAYVWGGVSLLYRSADDTFRYPLTKKIDGKFYTVMIDGSCQFDFIKNFAKDGESALSCLEEKLTIVLYSPEDSTVYIHRSKGGSPVFFAENGRLVFTTAKESLVAAQHSFSLLREDTLLVYDRQGLLIK